MNDDINNNNKLEQLKTDYQKLQPPPQLATNLEILIYKEHVKTKTFYLIKLFSLSAATIMITITILANSHADLAKAMEHIPFIGMISKVVTFRTYENKTPNFTADVDLPQIVPDSHIPSDSHSGMEKINKNIEDYIQNLISEHEADLIASNGIGKKELFTSYKVIENTDKFLSIQIDTSIIMNGSLLMTKLYHLDKIHDQQIELFDLFQKDSDYIATIVQNIREQMITQMEEDETITYYIGSDFDYIEFKNLEDTQNFYINEKKQLVLVFDKYSIAPGSMGIVEFTIPTELIKPFLTPLGRTWLDIT